MDILPAEESHLSNSRVGALPAVASFQESDVEAWHDVICQRFSRSNFARGTRRSKFSGHLRQFAFGEARISSIDASPLTYIREKQEISADHVDGFVFMLVKSGTVNVSQSDRRFVVKPGELFVYRHGLPFNLEFLSSYKAISIWVPPEVMDVHCYSRSISSPAILNASLANTGLAASMMTHLGCLPEFGGIQYSQLLSNAAIDVLASALPDQTGSPVGRTDHIFDILKDYVRQYIDDSDLSPERLATAAGISLRTLNRIFAGRAMTPMRWVSHIRLNESYAALAAGKHSSVIEATFAYGFKDSSHFSRTFSAHFGRPPSQVIRPG
ncbi:helix-turn-helix domain-containing protein [Rhizobium sp. Root1204]|uniref:helix-turn-helix domain-containing protein n=1 Tax=Rhizobium sp. Root1204 TaxID=1736428 RepID=UPI00138F125D|nr:helix-turn-helix domain-containing protein [Rhizobium sp. Root1204]